MRRCETELLERLRSGFACGTGDDTHRRGHECGEVAAGRDKRQGGMAGRAGEYGAENSSGDSNDYACDAYVCPTECRDHEWRGETDDPEYRRNCVDTEHANRER